MMQIFFTDGLAWTDKMFQKKTFPKKYNRTDSYEQENFPNMLEILAWICFYEIVPIKICCSDVKGMNTKKRFICKKDPKHVYLKMFMMLIYKKSMDKIVVVFIDSAWQQLVTKVVLWSYSCH